jgi:hypothetical protein
MESKLTRATNTRKPRDLLIKQEPDGITIEGTQFSLAALEEAVTEVARCRRPEIQTTLPDGRALRVVRWQE